MKIFDSRADLEVEIKQLHILIYLEVHHGT